MPFADVICLVTEAVVAATVAFSAVNTNTAAAVVCCKTEQLTRTGLKIVLIIIM